MAERILVIDDEAQITRVLRTALSAQGFEVRIANDPDEGLLLLEEWTPDLLITDLMMPGIDGIEICRRVRSRSKIPIIVLSVRDQERNKVEALDAGADDYITKPFGAPELLARVRAHLRRAPDRAKTTRIEIGDFVIDIDQHTATVQNHTLALTPTEFELLLYFAQHDGKVMPHRTLLTAVWGAQSVHQPEYLRVFIGQIRKKMEALTDRQYIQTEPWVGYRFVAQGVE